jgi:hypothetical protein
LFRLQNYNRVNANNFSPNTILYSILQNNIVSNVYFPSSCSLKLQSFSKSAINLHTKIFNKYIKLRNQLFSYYKYKKIKSHHTRLSTSSTWSKKGIITAPPGLLSQWNTLPKQPQAGPAAATLLNIKQDRGVFNVLLWQASSCSM